ncbi:MAG: hypothetical protein M1833_006270 [Piccolia ochrophora]|nr:MAG: hypothetical protein M1833_006270 [Piccolia ochrophora]
MLRFHKSLDVITLFHKPSSAPSMRVLTLLKQTAATASETATEDQAGDHSHQDRRQRTDFELNVTEEPPTSDQLRSIFEYAGAKKAGDIVKGARDEADAMKKLKESVENFQRPVTVDWNNGRTVLGDNESEILKLINTLPRREGQQQE